MIKCNTKYLFGSLLKIIKPDLICDIGSRDGYEALYFKSICNDAHVIAFEPVPILSERIKSHLEIIKHKIEVCSEAVSNVDGVTNMYLANENFEENPRSFKAGTSSLRIKRCAASQDMIVVNTVRLDTLFKDKSYSNIALWIDVEGCGFEVLEGMKHIHNNVSIIHVEVETIEYWKDQKLKTDIINMLRDFNFYILCDNAPKSQGQGDVLFLSKNCNLPKNIIQTAILKYAIWMGLSKVTTLVGIKRSRFLYRIGKNIRKRFLRSFCQV